MSDTAPTAAEGLEAVCELTGLRQLTVVRPKTAKRGLQLTQLQHLTALNYKGPINGEGQEVYLAVGVSWLTSLPPGQQGSGHAACLCIWIELPSAALTVHMH